MRLPYGLSDFGLLRAEGYYLVDKTEYIPLLESAERGRRYLAFLRPRRFGKSLLVSMLEHYYDIDRADEFEKLFGNLWIGQNATPERNSYLTLQLEFSGISISRGMERLRLDFLARLRHQLGHFARRYAGRLPGLGPYLAGAAEVDEPAILFHGFLAQLREAEVPLYLLIDEYDNFTNDLIARGDEETYTTILHQAGFVREFYETVKEGTKDVISRIFMTGVAPLTLDDLTSGFNIAKNIALHRDFNELAGFTDEEVAALVDGLLEDGEYTFDRDQLLLDLAEAYDGYLFSDDCTTRVYNPNMVLYFLSEVTPPSSYPRSLIDVNVRTDYGRLKRLLIDSEHRPRTEPVAFVQRVLTEGHIDAPLHESFPLDLAYREEYFLSYLYYLGMLTVGHRVRRRFRLLIPNQVVHQLYWEHFRALLEEVLGARVTGVTLTEQVEEMVFGGDVGPFLRLVYDRVLRRLSNRDMIKLDEKAIKLVLLTYLSQSGVYEVVSEPELNRGYVDLLLQRTREYGDEGYNFLIEVKYLKTKEGEEARVLEKLTEADAQLRQYLSEPRLLALAPVSRWKAVSVLSVGLERLYWRELGAEEVGSVTADA